MGIPIALPMGCPVWRPNWVGFRVVQTDDPGSSSWYLLMRKIYTIELGTKTS